MERPLDDAVKLKNLSEEIAMRWPDQVRVDLDLQNGLCQMESEASVLTEVCSWLFSERGYSFTSLIVEEEPIE
ncbi:MAG TPA: hypothetical protein VLZ03_02050, partial [Thermodesulfobacteriota bacterium]|nr:hypothetical protein [Thermodesulfobacteriota bacterium]